MNWFDFVLERYNYWVVITLMMTGLYIVFARGNLVKKIVGLNLFQTSVFIFYITIGKIAGGTAPIYIGGELDHGDDHGHGDGHGDNYETGHGGGDHGADLHEAGSQPGGHAEEQSDLGGKIENTFAANDLKDSLKAVRDVPPDHAGSLHVVPGATEKIANPPIGKAAESGGHTDPKFEIGSNTHGDDYGASAGHDLSEVIHHSSEVIYTNPLPHVLILTAIVVGVATTAVGLSLAVRIREAYGTIEEDELEAMDNVAEFGADAANAGAAS